MSVLDLRSTTALPALPRTRAEAITTVRLRPFLVRMLTATALTAAGWTPLYLAVLQDLPAGTRCAYLLAVPVLLAVLAAGHRTPPCGVGDAESDWIVAVLLGVAGVAGIAVLAQRMPTLAGLWRLPALTGVVWFVCVLTVLFGVRHVVRMWAVWVFALTTTTPLPFLLLTAELGGSDRAAVAVSAGIGAAAVALGTPGTEWRVRTLGTLTCLCLGLAIAWVTPHGHLVAATVVVTGAVPVLAVLALRRTRRTAAGEFPLPARSAPTMAILALLAAVLPQLGTPITSARAASAAVAPDWIGHTAWGSPRDFGFITRYLGPGSTLQRYSMLPVDGLPAAVVDVMSTSDAAALRDVADAVWYPSARPLDYRAAGAPLPEGARILHGDADAVTTGADAPWYAVTWAWTSGTLHQRITVLVSQSLTGALPPPAPLSLPGTSVRPLLWLARQQPDDCGEIDELVAGRARAVIDQVTAAAHV
ncbi:hypothetical protein GR927_43025 [Mycolicibacterium sp. 3033]|nr:hypothetical protein [Mycolicibacterium aurantiacum]